MAKVRRTPQNRLEILERVIRDGQSISRVCREAGISRFTFYAWAKKYRQATDTKNNTRRVLLLKDNIKTGENHPKSISGKVEKAILECVLKNPKWSTHKISAYLAVYKGSKYKVSNHGVYNVLLRRGLASQAARENYARVHPVRSAFSTRFSDFEKYKVIEEVQKGTLGITDICRRFNISRYTLYEWLKRYKDDRTVSSLASHKPKGESHYRFMGEEKEKEILDLVKVKPELSVHKLHLQLAGRVSHHGVQNVLNRYGLNTLDKRLEYVENVGQAPKVKTAPLYEPTIPLYKWRLLFAPFKTVPKLLVTNPASGLLRLSFLLFPLLVVFLFLRMLTTTAPGSSPVGLFFASIALTFGLFFFIYSMKYYITILMVLKLASSGAPSTSLRQNSGQALRAMEDKPFDAQGSPRGFTLKGKQSQRENVILSIAKNLILRSFGLRPQGDRMPRVNPLNINLAKVELEPGKLPFVSVHVALYNEKRVVERLMRACTSQEWFAQGPLGNWATGQLGDDKTQEPNSLNAQQPKNLVANYEVVIADDSTDETTEMVKQVLLDNGWSIYSSSEGAQATKSRSLEAESSRLSSNNNDLELFVFSKPNAPTVKLIHRFSRSGFKGGALQVALQNTDPRAQYITIFDADFIPYPDTITQFVKTFQVLGSQSQSGKSEEALDVSPSALSDSNIAAVQGYQWHVLNKSQTWVTRGVRTEYAGSYVIERAGEEIYQGLKQISGSVYCIRADVLRQFGWGTSITEDFELTLRLYEAGYKVAFTPYIQAPAEAVSTIKRLIRQRMRWAEGASFNVKVMLPRMLFGRWEAASQISNYSNYSNLPNQTPNPKSQLDQLGQLESEVSLREIRSIKESNENKGRVWVKSRLTTTEKLEFLYLAPYYLQAAFFVVGTISWFLSEAVFGSRLPFWTAAFGWSLVFTNLLALPLMNIVGLFLEESDERDYVGILSFIALSYIVVPFQAYAAVKGFLEHEEGPWFRTPKTGLVTDTFTKSGFSKFFGNILGGQKAANAVSFQLPATRPAFLGAFNPLNAEHFVIRPRHFRYIGNLALAFVLLITVVMSIAASFMPNATSYAQTQSLKTVEQRQSEVKADNQVQEESKPLADPTNPPNKEEILRNVLSKEITTSRAVAKTTKGGQELTVIFQKEPKVRVKLSSPVSNEVNEIEFETKAIGGIKVNPVKSKIYNDSEVTYEEIIKDVDLKYTLTNDLLVEEFIIKTPEAGAAFAKASEAKVEQAVKTVDVRVVSFDPSTFGFYSNDGRELFKLSAPFAKDSKGETSNDLALTLEKPFDFAQGYKLTKTLGESAKQWLGDPNRQYPVTIDPTVIVSGGIAEAETQFGGLQRKLVYMSTPAAWYAFYGTSANDCATTCSVNYKKSSDGIAWDNPAVDVDSSDTDNYNPSIGVSGDFIIVAWLDDGLDAIEIKSINTGSADALTGLCASGDEGSIDTNTFTISVAAVSTTEAVVAYSDTSSDTEFNVYDVSAISGATCTPTYTDETPGNITFGSGIGAGDRPVVVPVAGNIVDMIFQDGDLSYSRIDVSVDEWTRNNLQLANVTDNVYSVTTDGSTIWVLSVSGTTATNFYACCVPDIAETQLDSDAGANAQDLSSDVDMYCFSSTDCKIVYTDDIDVGGGGGPDLVFIDCDDEGCSTNQATVVDSDIGGSGDVANPAIYCVSSTDCKIVYGDNIGSAGPDLDFIDCTSADSATACGTPAPVVLNADIGASGTFPTASIDCSGGNTDCKVVFWEDDVDIVHFVDCSAADCSTQDTGSPVALDDNASGDVREYNSISCAVAASDCKVIFHDTVDGDLSFIDCSAANCATPAQVDVNANVGTADVVTNDIWCPAADAQDCKIVYHDEVANSLVFVDCGAIDCSTNTPTTVDSTAGFTSTRGGSASLNCFSVTDCKFVYDNGGANLYFVDCDSAACTSGSVIDLPGPRAKGAIQCPATANCKFAYYDGTASTNPTVQFADCDVTNCFPSQGMSGKVQLLDGNTGCVLTSCSTTADVGQYTSIACPTAADCKVSYFDAITGDLKFADCDTATCSSGKAQLLDGNTGCVLTGCSTTTSVGFDTSIACPTADDCKVSYYDSAGDLKFADCDTATCSSGTVKLLDGNTGCVLTGCSTTADVGQYTSIACPTADDCKISYYDSTGNLKFADCEDGTPGGSQCDSGTVTLLDGNTGCVLTSCSTTVPVGAYISIACPTADDCKISYYDNATFDLKFADCDTATCSSGTVKLLDGNTGCVLTGCSTTADVGQYNTSIACPTADDCKISYYDSTTGDLKFADCEDGTPGGSQCDSGTVTLLDGNTGCVLTSCSTTTNVGLNNSIACPTADDCKISYYGGTTGDLKFADCDTATCSSGTMKLLDGNTGCVLTGCSTTADVGYYYNSIACPTADDCKISYYADGATTGDLKFADCDSATCAAVTSLAVPWTGQTNVTSVSLTYDSTNADLYAHIIKDTSGVSGDEQAYYKSSAAGDPSWGSETSWGFSGTGEHLGHISAPMTAAGITQIAVVLRQGTNFEFSAVPERSLYLLGLLPFTSGIFGRLRKRPRRKKDG